MPSWKRIFLTRVRGWGLVRPARVFDLVVDGRFFPDVGPLGPLAVLRLDHLRLVFPAAAVRSFTRRGLWAGFF